MLNNLQILRFVAALAVVLYHAHGSATPAEYAPNWSFLMGEIFSGGFAGVDLFFVISGFVIAESTRSLVPGIGASRHFIAMRFSRIYLGWWPFFVLYLLSESLFAKLRAEVSLPASFFLLPFSRIEQMLVGITWTLTFELYFYLVTGILLLLPRRRLLLGLCIWGAAVLAYTVYSITQGLYAPARAGEITMAKGFLAPLVLEFIAGFLLCDYLRAHPATPWQPFAALGVVLAALAIGYQSGGGLQPGGIAGYSHSPERALLIGGACCCIAACALLCCESKHPLARWAANLGDASYSIYLSHLLVLTLFYIWVRWLGVPENFKMRLFLPAVAAVIAYSWLHYRWIERPLYRAVRNRIRAA